MKIISIANQKGGVGKTTTAVNLSAALTKNSKKILLIDLDPQANATNHFGIIEDELENTIYDVLKGKLLLEKSILKMKCGIDLIPSNIDMASADIDFSSKIGRESLLKNILSQGEGYDYVFIDCPPSLNILTLMSLVASRYVFIPVQTQYFSVKGVKKLLDTIDEVKKARLNKDLKIKVIGTLFDIRKNLHKDAHSQVRNYFADNMFKTVIRENVALGEAPSFGKTIFEHKPESIGAEDYINLAKEVMEGR